MKQTCTSPANKQRSLSIVWVDIDDLLFSDYNPRNIGEEAIARLAESMDMHGFVNPCIINRAPNRRNILIAGHARVLAAKRRGMKKVPVIFINEPNLEREKALNVKLNIDAGEWNFDLLRELFDIDFIVNVGFGDDDLRKIFDDALETEDDQFDVEKELAAIKEPKAKTGDLYQLGSNRLIVDDSTDPAVVERLMNGEKADLIDTDPPFAINLDYDRGVSGKKHYGGKTNDKMSEKQYEEFLRKLIGNAIAAAKPDAHYLFWCDSNWIWLLQTLYRALGIKHKRVCWWLKGNFSLTPGVAFNKAGEAAIYGTIGSPYLAPNVTNLHEIQDKEVGPGTRMLEDTMDLFSLFLCKRLPGSEYEHPTQKSPILAEKVLRRCTRPNDLVIDLTGGSGSLLIACEQMRRRAYLAELEPIFADLIIRRWESLTGLRASLLSHE